MEASQNKGDVTIQFLVRGLIIHFAAISHLPFSVQLLSMNFMLVQWLKVFCNFLGGKYDPLKLAFQILTAPKGTFLRQSSSIEALWSRLLFPFGLWGFVIIRRENGKHLR
jgi:hypothetical protein